MESCDTDLATPITTPTHHLCIGQCPNTYQYDSKRVKFLSDRLLKGLLAMEHTNQNGDADHFYPGCVNVSFAYVEGESLLMALKDIALSSGSAWPHQPNSLS